MERLGDIILISGNDLNCQKNYDWRDGQYNPSYPKLAWSEKTGPAMPSKVPLLY